MRTALSVILALAVLGGCRARRANPMDQAPAAGSPGLDPGLTLADDARVELVSIVCRLAGYPEYTAARGDYPSAVDAHFARFRDHPAVITAAALRAEHGLAFNGPIIVAAYLGAGLAPIRPLTPAPDTITRHWGSIDGDNFAAQLGAFARDSGLNAFRAAHADVRRQRLTDLAAALDGYRMVDWFDARFGPRPHARIRLVPGLLTGDNNYSASAFALDGGREILLVLAVPRRGRYSRSITYYVAHELAHSYVNEILDARLTLIAPAIDRVWASSREVMSAMNYGEPQIMVNESAVRALVVAYARERGPRGASDHERRHQERLGFGWIGPMTEALDRLDRPIDPDAMAAAVSDVFLAWPARGPQRVTPVIPERG